MKIKTITCHDVYNAGAGLQAYALSTYLISLGHDTEIIDYKPDYLSGHYSFTGVSDKYSHNLLIKCLYLAAKFPSRLRAYLSQRKKNYDRFKRDYLKTTPIRYSDHKSLTDNPPQADVYFAGSDQIWNTIFKNGKDPAFYLDFVPDGKIKASYAASFSTNELPEELKDTIKGWLQGIDYISVREKSALAILDSLGVGNAVQVLDPVFLLDRDEWDKLSDNITGNEKYILVYDFDNSEFVGEIARRAAKKTGCKIYSIFKCSYADKCFESEGPFGFVSLIKNAQLVISNSFHATAFSIIFNRQFAVVYRKEDINSRLFDLLSEFHLENRMIYSAEQIDTLSDISFEQLESIKKQNIKKSKDFIDLVISGAQMNE